MLSFRFLTGHASTNRGKYSVKRQRAILVPNTIENVPFSPPAPNPRGITRMAWKLDADGYIGLPPGPGLGVEVDEKRLEEEAKRPQQYRWPGARLRDGSVADY
jgi:hypothetical protein